MKIYRICCNVTDDYWLESFKNIWNTHDAAPVNLYGRCTADWCGLKPEKHLEDQKTDDGASKSLLPLLSSL